MLENLILKKKKKKEEEGKLHYWFLKFTLWTQLVFHVSSEHYWSLKCQNWTLLVIFLTNVSVNVYLANNTIT